MKGPAMAKILLEQRPTMKVLFMSGHSDVILLDRARVIAAIRER
jgi:FixJ family two-component response regulator